MSDLYIVVADGKFVSYTRFAGVTCEAFALSGERHEANVMTYSRACNVVDAVNMGKPAYTEIWDIKGYGQPDCVPVFTWVNGLLDQ